MDRDSKSSQSIAYDKSNLQIQVHFYLKISFQIRAFFIFMEAEYLVKIVVIFAYVYK